MDPRLLKAARLGDVALLASLLEEDPLILEKVALEPSLGTPLHTASLAGKAGFAKELLKLKPEFAQELNHDGFIPLHLASASGHIEVVKVLVGLETGSELCLVKDKAGWNSLHWAAIKGRVGVIEEVVACCPSAFVQVTCLGETACHLAVKNNQVDALKVLIEKVGHDNGEFLNAKDKEGHTILDLAVSKQQLQVLELLRTQTGIPEKDIIEVVSGVQETKYIPQTTQLDNAMKSDTTKSQQAKDSSSGEDDAKGIWEEVENMVLVVASLITTVTYQAGLSPPQTIWKEDMKLDSKCIFHHHRLSNDSSLTSPTVSCPAITYYLFMSFNTAGFFAATLLIFFFRRPAYVQVLLPVALISMMVTYITLSVPMAPNGLSLLVIYLITLVIFVYCLLAVEVVKTILHNIFGFAKGKVSGMAKKLARKRKSTPADSSKLDA